MSVKKIAILGSTGSIGRQTLEVIESLGPQYRVIALTAGSNDRLLADQILKFKPKIAVLSDKVAAGRLAKAVDGTGCQVLQGNEGQEVAATLDEADLVVMAQVGFSGFKPLVSALKQGKKIALANKESLVIGGEILDKQGLLDRTKIYPLDSEHSAIWQCLRSGEKEEVDKIYLTASGGPFFGKTREELNHVTVDEALKHPNWKMGGKITIDSATMMNKGLEIIEAMWLFGLRLDQVEVVVHQQSIVHSMVKYKDGSVIAQLGRPDMRLPIQYALTYPERLESRFENFDPFDLVLDFKKPDRDNFPCLKLACRAVKEGGTMPAVLNGANEEAVRSFLVGGIAFTNIAEVIETVMNRHRLVSNPILQDIIAADIWARREAKVCITALEGRMN
ncbi:MAG: 1-deoxy-D-xylulose-5-phosphate reductoisomerase [Bacillota bacterium]|nr:1-deoxy-D-xylulose-5-phosphate reductoisomerase [Bacillota bacterium]